MNTVVKILLWATYMVSLYFAIFWFLVLMDGGFKKTKKSKLKNYPDVSIVIPAYNEEKRIRLTLDSVLKLNYPKDRLEIIVINDGSADKTKEVVEGIISKNRDFGIRLISQKNRGKGAALNNGLKKAKGEFFVCLDADSYVKEDALLKMLPEFDKEDIAAVLPLLKVRNPKSLWQKMQWLEYLVNMFYKELMSRLNCVHVAPGPFSVYRKHILEKIGGFDENNLTEDLEISLRLQSHNYCIKQIMDAEVFTIAPESFKQLYKQRNRWYKGSVYNALKYRSMLFNKKYGDFGIIQMPTIIVSGLIAIILVASLIYYTLEPYVRGIYHMSFVNFDFYTFIRSFTLNFSLLDLNYMALMVAAVMLAISFTVLRKSHARTNEKMTRHGLFSLIAYIFMYFLVLGFIWIGIMFDLISGKKQRW